MGLTDVLGIVDRQIDEGTWTYSMLYDTRRLSLGQTGTQDEVRKLLKHVLSRGEDRGQRGPVAIVTDNPAYYVVIRLYASLGKSAHLTMEVFRDPGDAERWLAEHSRQA